LAEEIKWGLCFLNSPLAEGGLFFMLNVIKQFCGQSRTLTIPVPLLQFLNGDHLATLYLSQIIFWAGVMQKKGKEWFYKTDVSFAEEIYIPERTLQRLRSKFVNMGYIETKIKKLPNGDTALHYRLTDKLNQDITRFFVGDKNDSAGEQNITIGNPGNGNPGSPNCRVRVRQFGESSYIQKMSFTEDEHLKKETHFLGDPENLKSIKTEAPYGGHKSSIGVESKPSLASQEGWGVNNHDNLKEDNHTLNEIHLQEKQKRSGSSSPLASGGADTAAAAAWIESLNQKTGSTYPAAAGFIKAYQKVQKQNNLTNEQLLAVIDNAIASGLSGTWLNPNHLLRHALDFAFAAPRQNKQQTRSSTKRIAAEDLASRQGWVYIENPANNPNAKHINIESGFETGEIVNGQTVWYPDGSKSRILR
jgi:hypothetical protein